MYFLHGWVRKRIVAALSVPLSPCGVSSKFVNPEVLYKLSKVLKSWWTAIPSRKAWLPKARDATRKEEGLPVTGVCRRLVREAVLERGCKDNCTAIVIVFRRD